ncbi:MAG: hypothetical protein SVZ03_03535 [Spirochaetota bacterium]|nr:hypothetical protein [Spirochaetota bacterium]
MKEIVLVLLGFIFAVIPQWFDRKRKLKGHFCAIRAESELCRERAEIFLRDRILLPLYRMPLTAYKVSVPILLTESALSEKEAITLARFYCQAEDINRGLDNAVAVINDKDALQREYSRLILKCQTLVGPSETQTPLFDSTKKLLDGKIKTPWWKY